MEGAAGPYNGPTVEEVFKDFKGRRAGMIKALTTDVEDVYQQCDPERDTLCLYGFPDETWEVNIPVKLVPSDLPEPALGINLARDRMQEKDWLSLVAYHSDAWLLAVAVYFGARFGFKKNDRGRLFNMINELPTIFEVVTGTVKNHTKEKPVTNHIGNKRKHNAKVNRLRSMEGAAGPYNSHTVEEVFEGFKGRRAGMIKALTTDADELYQQCDPEKEKLCLWGIPSERWEVSPPDEVPLKLPEPTLGINYIRDGTQEKDWLGFIAVHSDAWLLSVAFYFGAHFGFEKNDRGRLFNMINELPTIFEVVTGTFDEEDDTLCGACGEIYAVDEFWICCDMCEIWFHGKCVKITPARAGHIKQYKCPSCSRSTKRART